MTDAGTPNSNFAGILIAKIYYATKPNSAIPLRKHPHRAHPLGYSLMQESDTLYRGIGLAHPL